MHHKDKKLIQPLLSGLSSRKEQQAAKSIGTSNFIKRIRHYHSAPELDDFCPKQKPKDAAVKPNFGNHNSKGSFVKAVSVFVVYLGIGMASFFAMEQELEGERTNSFVDALYFCIVTMTTVGYGDLIPYSVPAKLLTCAYVFAGFGLVGLLLGSAADFLVEKQETMLVKALENSGYEDIRGLDQISKIRWKVIIAGAMVLVLFGIGLLFLVEVEKLSFVDAFYCVCVTVTTLGYGDVSFHTPGGRAFAVVWILVSTISVAQFFLYATELYTEQRRQSLLHWVLTWKTTFSDLEAADMDNDGVVSASEFVLYKLKEMGKIEEQDVAEILREFDVLDVDNSGTLSPYDLKLAQTEEF